MYDRNKEFIMPLLCTKDTSITKMVTLLLSLTIFLLIALPFTITFLLYTTYIRSGKMVLMWV